MVNFQEFQFSHFTFSDFTFWKSRRHSEYSKRSEKFGAIGEIGGVGISGRSIFDLAQNPRYLSTYALLHNSLWIILQFTNLLICSVKLFKTNLDILELQFGPHFWISVLILDIGDISVTVVDYRGHHCELFTA